MTECLTSSLSPFFAAGFEDTLRPLLIQVIVIMLAARVGSGLARRLRQPTVVGEISAGLLLGPSGLGALAPSLFAAIFRPGDGAPSLEAALTGFSQIGLILLLFMVGLEFDFSHVTRQSRTAVAVSLAGVAVPFLLGLGLAAMMAPRLVSLGGLPMIDQWAFALFLATAMSITALPILGRILIEMGLQQTRLGAIVIASAACDDVVGWILLAAVSAIAIGHFNPLSTLSMLGATAALTAFLFLFVRPFALPWLDRTASHGDEPAGEGPRLSFATLSLVLAAVFISALVTSAIGIFAIFGAFLIGASLSGSPSLRRAITAHCADLVTVFFLPIFFTYTGLRTDIGSLDSLESWGWCASVLAVATVGKWGGCGLAAWLAGMPLGEAAALGVFMNTRALMELVVINVGMDLGVIPPAVYCMLTLMAIATTLMTTPLAARLLRGSSHEETLVEHGFLPHQPARTTT